MNYHIKEMHTVNSIKLGTDENKQFIKVGVTAKN